MKEFSIEEKAKAYDEALERARLSRLQLLDIGEEATEIEYIFPELVESEDERISKEIIKYLEQTVPHNHRDEVLKSKEWIAWLEKQGEQKLPIEKLPSEMKTIGESLGFTTQEECDEHNQMVSDLIMSDGNEIKPKFKVGDTIRLKNSTAEYTIESISGGCYHGRGWGLNIIDADKSGDYVLVEQKPVNKIEPKFKIGDWIACEELNTALIVNVDDNKYEVEFIDGNKGFSHIDYTDRLFHLWTIQDAKGVDVLDANGAPFIYKKHSKDYVYFYCGVNLAGDFIEANGIDTWDSSNKVHPATKKQRDLLFAKMKEAGYEWDAEKKELKKIHIIDEGKAEMDYCFSKMMNGEKVGPAWSEEDELKRYSYSRC